MTRVKFGLQRWDGSVIRKARGRAQALEGTVAGSEKGPGQQARPATDKET